MRPKIRCDGESWNFLRTKQGLSPYTSYRSAEEWVSWCWSCSPRLEGPMSRTAIGVEVSTYCRSVAYYCCLPTAYGVPMYSRCWVLAMKYWGRGGSGANGGCGRALGWLGQTTKVPVSRFQCAGQGHWLGACQPDRHSHHQTCWSANAGAAGWSLPKVWSLHVHHKRGCPVRPIQPCHGRREDVV